MTTLTRKIKALWSSWLIIATIILSSMAAASAGEPIRNASDSTTSYRIRSVNWDQSAEGYILRIKGGSLPTYTMYELFEPLRVIVDIADASFDSSLSFPIELPQGPVSAVNGKVLSDKKPAMARIELFLRQDHDYTVTKSENDILVKFPSALTGNPAISHTAPITKAQIQPEAQAAPNANQPAVAPGSSEIVNSGLATKLVNVEISKSPDETKVFLKTDGSIRNFKKVLLEKNPNANRPDRMYIDLNNIRLIGAAETITVGTSLSKIRVAKRQDGIRVVFDSGVDKLFDYSISKQSNGLLITVKEPASSNAIIANMQATEKATTPLTGQQIEPVNNASVSTASDNTFSAEPEQPSMAAGGALGEVNPEGIDERGPKKSFKPPSPTDHSFAGYNKQRITVDFYKIDLHNVFRLFGEISNLNIVVDEAVTGSLTLALNDVPWDFALDIIMNLKDLIKEERFNTIVISPKSKSFVWPIRALDNVEIKSDIQVKPVAGGLKISKRLEVPENVVEAKKLIKLANTSERNGDFAVALPYYEEAFSKWPDNASLAKRIASMCLVNLGQNAKALHYAQSVMRLSPTDNDAALQAAISLARMDRTTEAKEYFEKSVSGDKPSSESLTNYSSFCEEQNDYNCSLIQLKRHEALHGDTLDTMVSKARVYDKQGKQEMATQEYRTILLSGYELPPDLSRYVKGRVALPGR